MHNFLLDQDNAAGMSLRLLWVEIIYEEIPHKGPGESLRKDSLLNFIKIIKISLLSAQI